MNKTLKKLYDEDQEDRNKIDATDLEAVKKLDVGDKKRRVLVEKLIKHKELEHSIDFYHAAMIFQHGDTPSDYKQANDLAKTAMEMGLEQAKWLYAASLDRWMLSVNRPQKFGTQFITEEGGERKLRQPVDKTVTDEERAKYNVSPLLKN